MDLWLQIPYALNIASLAPVCLAMFTGRGQGEVFQSAVSSSRGLELLVGTVDLIDEEHSRIGSWVLEGLQKGPFDEVVAGEQRLLAQVGAACLCHSDAEELARVVPFIEGLGCVDALKALKPDEGRVEHLGERLRGLGLADPRLALEEEWLWEAYCAEQRRGKP